MVCVKCGSNIPEELNNCPVCNAPVSSEIEEAVFINEILEILGGV